MTGTPAETPRRALVRWGVLIFALAFCFSPWCSPAIALAIGLAFGCIVGVPGGEAGAKHVGKAAKLLLQISVALLGFKMVLPEMLASGSEGMVLAIITIGGTMLLGLGLGRALQIDRNTRSLIAGGTAICGGSAIAAISTVIGAAAAEISVAMGTVFLLNAVALYVFPLVGHALDLSPNQFGTWAGIAIHDVSSVVGAAESFSPESLKQATTVKLTRALWIVPVALIYGAHARRKVRSESHANTPETLARRPGPRFLIPWFIACFVLASVVRTYVPGVDEFAHIPILLARRGLTASLLLIGAGVSLATLRSVGLRAFSLGLILWIVIASVSLFAVMAGGGSWST